MKTANRALGIAPIIGLLLLGILVSAVGHAQTAAPYTAGYYYNIGRQLTGAVQPCVDGGCPATEYIYNTAGLVTTVYEGSLSAWPGTTPPTSWSWLSINRVTVNTYDSLGRLSTETVESQSRTPYKLTQYAYDSMSRVECVAIRMSPATEVGLGACSQPATESTYGWDRITETTYDAQNNRPLVITRGYGTPNQESYATYTYNSNGLVSTITDANGNMTALGYDGFDRLSVQEFPSKTAKNTPDSTDEEKYTYDNDNNMLTRVTRDGETIQYDYDALNRMDEKIAPNEQTVYYGYNLQNQRMYANFVSQTGQGVSDTYDGFGDLTSETVNLSGAAQMMAYQYDADGDRTRVAYPDLNYVTYVYDGLDRLSEVLESGNAVLATYNYNPAGELTGIARGSGSPATGFGYDAIARLSSLSQTLAPSAGGPSVDDVSFSYQFNPADQIVSDDISNAAYYPLVNGATESYAPNGLNEYSTVGGTTYIYDGRGNLTSDGMTSYAYDVENRLTGATGWKLSYDPLGRLYSVTNTAATTTTTFIYDGDRITAEYDGSGNLLQRYVYGGGGDDPIVWYEGSGFGAANRQYLLADLKGSIIDVTDSSGNALAVNQYHPYGLGGSTNEGRFQFTGQAYIPEIGLYYYKARMYNPSIGRFMQTDPIGYKSDLDLYAYVGNDPIDRGDPSGLCVEDLCIGETVLAVEGVEAAVDAYEAAEAADAATTAAEGATEATSGTQATAATETQGASETANGVQSGQKTYTTYTRANEETGEVYSGRTSGKGSPEEQVKARTSSPDHQQKTSEGYGRARVDKNSANPDAIRGREQQLIEQNGGARSQGGTSGNAINGVSPENPKAPQYQQACQKEFGCG